MYEKAIVSFIDILGFKEFVENSSAELIKSILDRVHKFTKPIITDEKLDYETEADVISFSDCIIRVRRTERELNVYQPLGFVVYELDELLIAQGELAAQGIFLRGGITYGDIYFHENMIYGPALNQAYELENQYAVYPRIVLSPHLISETKINRLLKDEERTHEEELEYIEELIKEGDEGIWFVDYLRGMRNLFHRPKEFVDYLLKHKKNICEGAQKFKKINKPLIKYLWLAKYHNDFIQSISEEHWHLSYRTDRSDLEIQTDEVPMLQDLRA